MCSDASLRIVLPSLEDEFRPALGNILVALDWVELQRICKFLIRHFGKGRFSLLACQTLYVQVFDEFVDRVLHDFGVDIISQLLNMPGMPVYSDGNESFIQQRVVMVEIARQFGSVFDESRLPRGMASPSRDQVQIVPVADADTVDNFIVPTDIGSSLLTSFVEHSGFRSNKRRAAFESDEDEALTPKRSIRPRISESSVILITDSSDSESGLSLVTDSSDSDLSPDSGAGRPMRLARDQEEPGLGLDVDIKENRFL